jgi:5'-methylthioadenosine phosphorylase
MAHQPVIGVIGGSGLYEIEGLSEVEEVAVETPFGDPSDRYRVGQLDGAKMVFLPRHGRGHRLSPSELPFCANIYGLKKLGVQWLISVSAVGSMREEIEPGHMVIVDQFIDRTKNRRSTFFGDGIVGHVEFADPVCAELAEVLYTASVEVGATAHKGGTYVCIEGPQFSTRAESTLYRQWDVDVIGMTAIPEAKLAREAGLCYATIALSTDYDCWHQGHDDVTVEAILETMGRNVGTAKQIVAVAARMLAGRQCDVHCDAGKKAVVTAPEAITSEARERLALILGD